MKILISGGSGFVGVRLQAFLKEKGHQVSYLSRSDEAEGSIAWDPENGRIPESAMTDTDVVINLAGANIAGKRWTNDRKKILRSSRIDSTRTLVNAIGKSNSKPSVFISMSGINYYAQGGDPKREGDPPGEGFLAKLCTEWEFEAMKAVDLGVRTVILRLGVVLDPSGGALKKMLPPFRIGLGGPIGSGSQGFPWISMLDLLHVIDFAIETASLHGPVNVMHPDHVSQKTFSSILGSALNRPAVMPLPEPMVRLMFGQMGEEMLLADMNVRPDKLVSSGYEFHEITLEECLHDLFSAK